MSLLSVTKSGRNSSSKKDKMNEAKLEGDIFKFVNIILIIALVGIIIVGGYKYYIFHEKGMLIPRVKDSVALKNKGFDVDTLGEKGPFSYFEGTISRRNIFQAPWEKNKEEVSTQIEEVPEIRRNIKLVGIVLDDNPTAIIEDIKKGTTMFMLIGDTIYEAVLEEIQEGKVIFLQNGDRIEITQ